MTDKLERKRIAPSRIVLLICAIAALFPCVPARQNPPNPTASPTFYKDVLPILQDHCQRCHRAGEIAPMPLVTYDETYRYTAAIQKKVSAKEMPPWFADPRVGHFADDPSLAPRQIATLVSWVDAGAPQGDP